MNESVKKRTLEKEPSYCRFKESAIGGFFMPRSYLHLHLILVLKNMI